MANRADPDQFASSEANRSGTTLFAKAGYIWVQQDNGLSESTLERLNITSIIILSSDFLVS